MVGLTVGVCIQYLHNQVILLHETKFPVGIDTRIDVNMNRRKGRERRKGGPREAFLCHMIMTCNSRRKERRVGVGER